MIISFLLTRDEVFLLSHDSQPIKNGNLLALFGSTLDRQVAFGFVMAMEREVRTCWLVVPSAVRLAVVWPIRQLLASRSFVWMGVSVDSLV